MHTVDNQTMDVDANVNFYKHDLKKKKKEKQKIVSLAEYNARHIFFSVLHAFRAFFQF